MDKITDLGRIDRAVADNLADIRESFDDYSGIVQDFIVFISQQLKYDLFGFTKFTLEDFCKSSGRNRQDLALIHPLFTSGKKQAPDVNGFKFQTVFDYALIVMMQRNLIFKNSYETKENEQRIVLESIKIISDVRLNINRKAKEVKLYEVRISQDLLDGFIKRYYTIDNQAYKLVGKGKGGDNRKSFLIYLSRLRHILFSQQKSQTIIPLDVLCKHAGITAEKSFHRKQSLERVFDQFKEKGKFAFEYAFVSATKGNAAYHVKITFLRLEAFDQIKAEHIFYKSLLDGLRTIYDRIYSTQQFENRKEPFQDWLSGNWNHQEKADLVRKVFYKQKNKNLTDQEIEDIFQFGLKEL